MFVFNNLNINLVFLLNLCMAKGEQLHRPHLKVHTVVARLAMQWMKERGIIFIYA